MWVGDEERSLIAFDEGINPISIGGIYAIQD